MQKSIIVVGSGGESVQEMIARIARSTPIDRSVLVIQAGEPVPPETLTEMFGSRKAKRMRRDAAEKDYRYRQVFKHER